MQDTEITIKREDLTVLDSFKFDVEPVAIKFLIREPQHVRHIEGKMTLCEMLVKAQQGDTFYAESANLTCGSYVLGWHTEKQAPTILSGEYGAGLQVFRDERAASRLYHYLPHIERNVVNYVAFSPVHKLSFDPDVLLILASVNQAEILLRAMSYRSGQMWSSKYSTAVGCAWLLAYPYLSGEINFINTGLGFGMKRRKLFPEGRMFVSIPFDRLPSMLDTLKEMPWVPGPFKEGGMEFARQLRIRLGVEE